MKHLQLNDKAPEFIAKDHVGKTISSKDFKGKKWVIYFYPKDLTPGCTTQACNIRDNYKLLQENGISILGVSMDDEKLHQRFIEKFDLPFPLLADTDRKVIDAFGVWGEKKFMGKIYDGIHRTTFVMNEDNIIIGIIEKPKTKEHSEEILEIYLKS
jgi:thioredoxin-dependent peroxiredoxin